MKWNMLQKNPVVQEQTQVPKESKHLSIQETHESRRLRKKSEKHSGAKQPGIVTAVVQKPMGFDYDQEAKMMRCLMVGVMVLGWMATLGMAQDASAASRSKASYTKCVLKCNKDSLVGYKRCNKIKNRGKKRACLTRFFKTSSKCVPACYRSYCSKTKTKTTKKKMVAKK